MKRSTALKIIGSFESASTFAPKIMEIAIDEQEHESVRITAFDVIESSRSVSEFASEIRQTAFNINGNYWVRCRALRLVPLLNLPPTCLLKLGI